MKNSKPKFKTPDEAEAVYYEAFMHCDQDVMAVLWAQGDVVCIHPGSAAIIGHAAVVRSWTHIFANAQRPDIKFTVMKKTLADGLAVHLVAEEIATSGSTATLVLATNVYQLIDDSWLMVEHHASLVPLSKKGQTLQ
jgi:ketosteroid isomerase-like protein